MYFTQGKLFEHAFFFATGEKTGEPIKFDEVKSWCTENLSGQWLVYDNNNSYSRHSINVSFYSRAVHKSPVNEVVYPPAEIKMTATYLIAFELEEDATAFKLRWDQVNVC